MKTNEEFDYIVKCKEIDVEVSDTLQKRLREKNTINILIGLALLFIFLIIQVYDATKKILFPTIFLAISTVVILKVMAFEIKWKLRIKERKIYIDYCFGRLVIEYSDLVKFELTKVHHRYKKHGDGLAITYMKNGKIKKFVLEIGEYLKPEISKICKSFVKKSQLKANTNLYNDYFDISTENIDTKLKALEKHNNKEVIKFIGAMLFIMIILILLCCGIFLQ